MYIVVFTTANITISIWKKIWTFLCRRLGMPTYKDFRYIKMVHSYYYDCKHKHARKFQVCPVCLLYFFPECITDNLLVKTRITYMF